MGKPETYEFSSMEDGEANNVGKKEKKEGCFVSTISGFVLFLLAAVLAVGVGIIVHFAGNRQHVECRCTFPGSADAGASSGQKTTSAPSVDQCKEWASSGNREICDACQVTSSAVIGSSTTAPSTERDPRLPSTLFPESYTLEIQPFIYEGEPENFNFTGHVTIRMHCQQSTKNITLHISNLNLTSENITIMEEGGNSIGYTSIEMDAKRQFVIFHLKEDLTKDKVYTIEMSFVGPLNNDLYGLYYSAYNRGNETIYVIASILEPAEARAIFPCFDEPAMKAKFDITIVRKSHMVALSTTPNISSENRGNGWIADTFQTTVVMPTYLLSFVISDFEYTETVTKNNVTIRAWARPEAVSQTSYGTHICANVTTALEDYLGVLYPLPKQDNFPIPDSLTWAMENWGLITYRERTLLYDDADSSEVDKQRVAEVVSHELGHMWFGNLVSPAWWDQLWLNEGFATIFQYIAVDLVNPDWHMMEQIIEDIHLVFNFDGLMTSRPMVIPVEYASEALSLFDDICYLKGASMIRMMKFFLGENIWLRGLTRYLTHLQYGVAKQDDLWFALGNQSKEDGGPRHDVKDIMDTWTLQMNYPVVHVTRESNNRIKVEQKRFLRYSDEEDPEHFSSMYDYRWEIPFTFTTSSGPYFNQTYRDIMWLGKEGAPYMIQLNTDTASSSWIIGNVMLHGYYRVNYDENNWNEIIKQLNSDHKVIHLINRAQIINDAFHLATSGHLQMEIAVRTVEYIDKEMDYLPWKTALNELAYLGSMLETTEIYGKIGEFMRMKLEGIFNNTGLDNTEASHIQSLKRTMISEAACNAGVKVCVDKALLLFSQWMNAPTSNPIDASVRSAVYCTAIRNGGMKEWDFVYEHYQMANVAHEQLRLLTALACTKEMWLVNRLIRLAISTDHVRKHDATPLLIALYNNDIASSAVWDFVRAKWKTIVSVYGFDITNLIPKVTRKLNTKYHLEQLEEFIEKYETMGTKSRTFQQAVENTKLNIRWMEDHQDTLKTWLQNY